MVELSVIWDTMVSCDLILVIFLKCNINKDVHTTSGIFCITRPRVEHLKTATVGASLSGPRFKIKTVFPGIGISTMKIRQSRDRLIFIMGILILGILYPYIETSLVYKTAFTLPLKSEKLKTSTLLMLELKYPRRFISIPCLLMPWLLASPLYDDNSMRSHHSAPLATHRTTTS